MIPVKEALEIIRNHAKSWNNPEVSNSEFDLAFESIPLKNSANRIQNINPLFERSEFGFMLPNKLNFRNLFIALSFLLRFWVKPKMKEQPNEISFHFTFFLDEKSIAAANRQKSQQGRLAENFKAIPTIPSPPRQIFEPTLLCE